MRAKVDPYYLLALDYLMYMNDVAIVSKGFPGWSLADIKAMPVRERRYWTQWVTAIAERKH
jgi:hypothetical protein